MGSTGDEAGERSQGMDGDLQRLAHRLLALSESNTARIDRLVDRIRQDHAPGSWPGCDGLDRAADRRGPRETLAVKYR